MRLSEDRISHLSHLVVDTLYRDDLVDYPEDNDQPALRATKRFLLEYFSAEEKAAEAARLKITSQSRKIVEGSPEWEVLFRKYLSEEMKKRFP